MQLTSFACTRRGEREWESERENYLVLRRERSKERKEFSLIHWVESGQMMMIYYKNEGRRRSRNRRRRELKRRMQSEGSIELSGKLFTHITGETLFKTYRQRAIYKSTVQCVLFCVCMCLCLLCVSFLSLFSLSLAFFIFFRFLQRRPACLSLVRLFKCPSVNKWRERGARRKLHSELTEQQCSLSAIILSRASSSSRSNQWVDWCSGTHSKKERGTNPWRCLYSRHRGRRREVGAICISIGRWCKREKWFSAIRVCSWCAKV